MARKEKKKEDRDVFHYLKIAAGVLFLALLCVVGIFSYRLGGRIFSDEPLTDDMAENVSYELKVTEGESVLAIGRDLKKHGVIESGLVFFIQSRIYKCKIDPGTYDVNSKDSSKAILKALNQAYLDAREDSSQ